MRCAWALLAVLLLTPGVAACQTRGDCSDAMEIAAADLGIPGVLDVRGWGVEAEFIGWTVSFDGDGVVAELGAGGRWSGAPEQREAVERWFRETSARLKDLAASVERQEFGASRIDMTTQYRCFFNRQLDEPNQFMASAKFLGDRLMWTEFHSPDTIVDPPPAGPPELEIEIKPDRAVWQNGETITGSLVIRNIGTRRVSIAGESLPEPLVLRPDGTSPPEIEQRLFICGMGMVGMPGPDLAPGEVFTDDFSIPTDPLGRWHGFALEAGAYVLSYPDLGVQFNYPSKTISASVTIAGSTLDDLANRIADFAVGDGRLTVVRAGGRVDSYSLETGLPLASVWPDAGLEWGSWIVLSTDAEAVARVEGPEDGGRRNVVIADLGTDPVRVRMIAAPNAPGTDFPMQPYIEGFSADHGTLFLGSSNSDAAEIDVESGRFTVLPLRKYDPNRSPDGAHFVTFGQAQGTFAVWDAQSLGAPRRSVAWPGSSGNVERHALARGFLLIDYDREIARFLSYDGVADHVLPDRIHSLHSGSAGELAALTPERGFRLDAADPPCTIQIWDVEAPARLWTLPRDGARRVRFSSDSQLVVSVHEEGAEDRFWLGDTFEVYDARTGTLLGTFEAPGSAGGAIRFLDAWFLDAWNGG